MLQQPVFLKKILPERSYPPRQKIVSEHTHQPDQQEHDSGHNIFPQVVPEVALNLPSPDGAVPLQQDGADCAQQGKGDRCHNMEGNNSTNLNLPAAQENNTSSQIANKDEQAVGEAERLTLSWQKPNRPLQRRVAGQKDADWSSPRSEGPAPV